MKRLSHGLSGLPRTQQAWARRALAAPPPDVAGAPLLPDARFILEKEADALVFVRTLNFSQQRRGSF